MPNLYVEADISEHTLLLWVEGYSAAPLVACSHNVAFWFNLQVSLQFRWTTQLILNVQTKQPWIGHQECNSSPITQLHLWEQTKKEPTFSMKFTL